MALPTSDAESDEVWFVSLLDGLPPNLKKSVKERGFYFNYKSDAEQVLRYHEFFDVFARVLERNKAILKSSIWNALLACYGKLDIDAAHYKDDAYAFKQSLMKLVDKQRHCTSGKNQVEVIQRLIRSSAREMQRDAKQLLSRSASRSSLGSKSSKAGDGSKSSKRKSLADELFPPSPAKRINRKLDFTGVEVTQASAPSTAAPPRTPAEKRSSVLEIYGSSSGTAATTSTLQPQQSKPFSSSEALQPAHSSAAPPGPPKSLHSAQQVLRLYGCSPLDKSKPRVPAASQQLFDELLQDRNKPSMPAAAKSQLAVGAKQQLVPKTVEPKQAKKDSYVEAKQLYLATFPQATNKDWNSSEARTECVNNLSRSEVVRRRLQKLRPDLFPSDD